MTSKSLWISVAVSSLAVGTVEADEGGWTDIHQRDGVRISARERAGSALKEMRAIGEINAPPERVLAVLDDIERYPQFMPPTTEARLLSRGRDNSYYYMVITPPVIARRDYCIRVGQQHLDDGRMRSYWVTDNAGCPPEQRGIVRVKSNDGEWLLTPIDGGRRTYVVYRCHIEVGGAVPSWMVNRVSATELPNVFAAVKRAVSEARYAAACRTPDCK